jgi:outer membrane protein OmpA-like peptidoglycan-associated protein
MKTLKIKWVLVLLCVVAVNFTIGAQYASKLSTSTLLKKADIAYQDEDFAIAADYYSNYLLGNSDPLNVVNLKLANCYWQMWDNEKAFQIYKRIYPSEQSEVDQNIKIRVAECYARNNQYNDAAKWLKGVDRLSSKARGYGDPEALNNMKKDSLNWDVKLSIINSEYRDYSPFLKNGRLFFSSNKPLSVNSREFGRDGNSFSHLWDVPALVANLVQENRVSSSATSRLKIDTKGVKKLAGIYECGGNKLINTAARKLNKKRTVKAERYHVGTLVRGLDGLKYNIGTFSLDKYNHAYFTTNSEKKDKDDVYQMCIMQGDYSEYTIKNIKKVPFGEKNSYSIMHPSVNWDGTVLVCSSDMPTGQGNFDLYYSTRADTLHTWEVLKSFGNNINSPGTEVFPSITRDGFLYFSSSELQGLGGLDIYKIPLAEAIKGTGTVEHISYPINSSADDFSWTQDSTGTLGFFTSDRQMDNDDIYRFNYSKPKLIEKYLFTGYVKKKNLLTPLEGSRVLIYITKEDSVYITKTDIDGKYQFIAHPNSKVIIKATAQSYISDCISLNVNEDMPLKDSVQNVPRDLILDKPAIGSVYKLNNLRYDFNKTIIRPDAALILDSLVAFLKKSPVTVELGSHTDSRGSAAYNARLSQHRADSAVAYLIKKGIAPKRITSKGYGASKLLNKCKVGVQCSDEEHQANRRTEVKVVGYVTLQNEPGIINTDVFGNGKKISINQLPKGFFEDCNSNSFK